MATKRKQKKTFSRRKHWQFLFVASSRYPLSLTNWIFHTMLELEASNEIENLFSSKMCAEAELSSS